MILRIIQRQQSLLINYINISKINRYLMNKNTTDLYSLKDGRKVKVLKYMENFFLKKDFSKKKFIYLYFINSKFFRKLFIFIQLVIKCNFIFNNPEKKDIIIYDCESARLLPKVLPNNASYLILSTRILNIKKIYISKQIVFYVIKNFFNHSLKQNYLIALILLISPKVVITRTDNSIDFHITSKALKDKIRFIAIQNANRGDTVWSPENKTKEIFIPEFFCFSEFDELIHKKKKCKIEKYKLIGSIHTSLCLEQINEEKKNLDRERYDVCLISEPHPIRSGDYSHIPKFEEAVGKIAKYTLELCKRKNLRLIFCGQGEPGNEMAEMEQLFYAEHLKGYNFKIDVSPRAYFPTYRNMIQSKIIIGHISTVLREAFAFEKKSCVVITQIIRMLFFRLRGYAN